MRFHDKAASGWRRGYRSGGFQKRRRFVWRQLQELVTEGERWLDAGCGSGVLTDDLAVLGARGYAIDASRRMIDEAVRTAIRARERFEFQHVATLEMTGFADQYFDGVLCSSVIEYLKRPDLALVEFGRVIRPGGWLLLSVANRYSAIRNGQRLVRAGGKALGLDAYSYLSVLQTTCDRSQIANALQESGFSVDNVRFFDPFLPRAIWTLAPPSLIFVTARRLESSSPLSRNREARQRHHRRR